MLKIWQKLAFPLFFIVGLFKVILILSTQDPGENPEHQLEVLIFISTTAFDLSFRNEGFEHVNSALGHFLEETDESEDHFLNIRTILQIMLVLDIKETSE